MKVKCKTFSKCPDAKAFATHIGKENLINMQAIIHPKYWNISYEIIVWYWADKEEGDV